MEQFGEGDEQYAAQSGGILFRLCVMTKLHHLARILSIPIMTPIRLDGCSPFDDQDVLFKEGTYVRNLILAAELYILRSLLRMLRIDGNALTNGLPHIDIKVDQPPRIPSPLVCVGNKVSDMSPTEILKAV